jgi:hypothetical protein
MDNVDVVLVEHAPLLEPVELLEATRLLVPPSQRMVASMVYVSLTLSRRLQRPLSVSNFGCRCAIAAEKAVNNPWRQQSWEK